VKYTVENTATEQRSTHRTWSAAMRAAARHLEQYQEHQIIIIEKDRDGEREYNTAGQILSHDGHFH
jgi:hypothetical protein